MTLALVAPAGLAGTVIDGVADLSPGQFSSIEKTGRAASRTAVSLGPDSPLPSRGSWLAGQPEYDWWYGCSPTAGSMLVGYWDSRPGYGDLFDGDASSFWGDTSTTTWTGTKGMIASYEHALAGSENGYDYGDWADSPSLPNHAANPNCMADFMKTVDGGSYASEINAGLEAYIEWDNPATAVNESYQATVGQHDAPIYQGGDLNWGLLVNEIDAGRPVQLGMVMYDGWDADGTRTPPGWVGHSVLAYGYQEDMFNVYIPTSDTQTHPEGYYLATVGGFAVMDTWMNDTGYADWWSDTEDFMEPVIDGDGVEWWPFVPYEGSSWTDNWDWMITEAHTVDIQVPEPGLTSLLAIGALAVLRRRRR